MAPNSSKFFSVSRCEPELVRPVKPAPRRLEKLSDIDDQEGLRFHKSYIFFYKASPSKGKDPVKVVREALSRALVYYFPFAGRIREGDNRKLMVDCDGQGVSFIEADAESTLEQIINGDHAMKLPPCPYIDELLCNVPGSDGILACPLLLIQVTRFRCGGFSFAVRMNHTITDSLGLIQFLTTIGELALDAPTPSQLPVWQREILSARKPPRITCIHHEYSEGLIDNNIVHQSFYFCPNELKTIRSNLPPHLQNRSSTFEILTAFLWKCRTISLQLDPHEVVRVSCMVTARGKQGIEVPSGYYGNAFAFPMVLSEAGLVCEGPLEYALELVKKIRTQTTVEYIRSVTDLMVLRGRPCYTKGVESFIVADMTRIPFGKIDFGWGKPVCSGIARLVPPISYFSRFRNGVSGEEGIVVPIWLPPTDMERSGSIPPIISHSLSEGDNSEALFTSSAFLTLDLRLSVRDFHTLSLCYGRNPLVLRVPVPSSKSNSQPGDLDQNLTIEAPSPIPSVQSIPISVSSILAEEAVAKHPVENRGANMIAHLFNAPVGEDETIVVVGTVGSFGAIMLAGLACKRVLAEEKIRG
ncbi:hypothetical protein FNV43_RR10392 [Rhamnella rubrinervis]|uniref:Benzyl alcohol O-benzoyltransferase n=1 Tax=Rhamnella rubrinervis TaxID=2594499 RepID=A0A8K0MKN7_9ROSA|nr:hypothetical protein FNV43_RR10392 [Rhamnella rubrinervis]